MGFTIFKHTMLNESSLRRNCNMGRQKSLHTTKNTLNKHYLRGGSNIFQSMNETFKSTYSPLCMFRAGQAHRTCPAVVTLAVASQTLLLARLGIVARTLAERTLPRCQTLRRIIFDKHLLLKIGSLTYSISSIRKLPTVIKPAFLWGTLSLVGGGGRAAGRAAAGAGALDAAATGAAATPDGAPWRDGIKDALASWHAAVSWPNWLQRLHLLKTRFDFFLPILPEIRKQQMCWPFLKTIKTHFMEHVNQVTGTAFNSTLLTTQHIWDIFAVDPPSQDP